MKAGILLLAIPLTVVFSCGKKEKTVTMVSKPMTEAVYASGSIEPVDGYKLYSLADGNLRRKLVKPGDPVIAGQVLFEIENEPQQKKLLASEKALKFAEKNGSLNSDQLTELLNQVNSLKEKYRLDSLNFIRQKNLNRNGIGAEIDFNKAELSYSVSRNDYLSALNRYRRTHQQLEVETENMRSLYQAAFTDFSNYQVKSEVTGRVFDVYKEQGELVRKGEILAYLGSSSKFLFNLTIDEGDISKIQTGQKVWVTVDAFPDSVFEAVISRIYPFERKADQSFRVDAVPVSGFTHFLPGMSVEANIIIQTKQNAMVLPGSGVMTGDSVWVKKDGKKRKVKVQIGARNFDWVEITGGLMQSDEVILP